MYTCTFESELLHFLLRLLSDVLRSMSKLLGVLYTYFGIHFLCLRPNYRHIPE